MLKLCNYLARNIYVQLSEIIRPYTLFQIAISSSFAALFFFFAKHIDEPLCLGTNVLYPYVTITNLHFLWYHKQRLILSNDVKVNPGPTLDSSQNFTICHWNLNSVAAHDFYKINLLKAYLTIHKTDIKCLSETYLDSSFLVNDENLVIQGYNLVRCDHFTNSKRGGVCIYYKDSLPLKIIDIHHLQECINFHLIIGGKLCDFITLYRSPNQSHDEFNLFIKNLELNLDKKTTYNPFLVVVLGYFNAKSCNWYINDKTNFEGAKIDILTLQNGLHQIIKESTHILDTSSSCIDLFFTSQPELVMDSGVHASLRVNFHHQIIFARFNSTL